MSWMLWYTTNVTTLTPAHKLTGLSPKKTVAADATNDDEGCDDVDDEDSASFKRDADEYEDDTDHVEDEPMPTPNSPENLQRFAILYLLQSRYRGKNVTSNISNTKDHI